MLYESLSTKIKAWIDKSKTYGVEVYILECHVSDEIKYK